MGNILFERVPKSSIVSKSLTIIEFSGVFCFNHCVAEYSDSLIIDFPILA